MDLFPMLSTYTRETLIDALFDPKLAPGNPDLALLNPENFFQLGRVPLLNVNLVKALIDEGHLDVDAKNNASGPYLYGQIVGCTILHYAVMWTNFELIDMLVEKNADVNFANNFLYEYTPLETILDDNSAWDSAMRIRLLRALNAKGNLDIRATGLNSPLWNAILLGIDMLDELILMGVNINEKMRCTFFIDRPTTTSKCSQITVFTFAVVSSRFDVALALKQRGADTEVEATFHFSQFGEIFHHRALEFVCMYGTVGELGRLLDIGVNVNAVDDEGRTALWRATELIHHNNWRKREMLIYHNADVSIRCSARTGRTTAFELARNDQDRQAMEQTLARRRALHAWALLQIPHRLPRELVPKILLENGL